MGEDQRVDQASGEPAVPGGEPMASPTGSAIVAVYGLTIFLGALLVFQVQPMIARYILPWFGGSAAVWTTCVLFFQAMLLVGYAYAHLVITRVSIRVQVVVHLALLGLAIVSLPIVPAASLAPNGAHSPTLRILLILAVSVGLPYAVLSTTSPLVQRWYTMVADGASPYRFYALSNAGSLIGLLSYPFIVEPLLTRVGQARLWGAGFVIQAVAYAACALHLWRRRPRRVDARAVGAAEPAKRPAIADRLLWVALPAVASLLLLAYTNQICQDVASMPFLWVVPMALYLLSFVLSFDRLRWYRRRAFAVALVVVLEGSLMVLLVGRHVDLWVQVVVHCAALFVACMVCHGELYLRRPGPRDLTSYYLLIAVGGALGGILVGVASPLVFDAYLELHVGMAAILLLAILAYRVPPCDPRDLMPRWARAALVPLWLVLTVILVVHAVSQRRQVVAVDRNFHGVLRIVEEDSEDPAWHRMVMMHGGTDHGFQFADPARSALAVAYYGEGSGAGVTLRTLARPGGRRIGVIGLGAGILATYGEPGDELRYFELNPAVSHFARRYFSYLDRSGGQVEIVEGDGRLLLEKEPSASFDILILDAFSSDSIPVHLLTVEAFATYERLLVHDGVVAAHLTNRHMDLAPVAVRLAATWGSEHRVHILQSPRDDRVGAYSATYVVVSRNPHVSRALVAAGAVPADPAMALARPWTDDFCNPLEVLRWR